MALTYGSTHVNLAPRGVHCTLACSLKSNCERLYFKAKGRSLSDSEGDTWGSHHHLKHPAFGSHSLEHSPNGKSCLPESRITNVGKFRTDSLAGICLLHWLLTTRNNIAYTDNFIKQLYLLTSRSVQYGEAPVGSQFVLFEWILVVVTLVLAGS